MKSKVEQRKKRALRIRSKIRDSKRLRLTVSRTSKHIYCQIIETAQKTLGKYESKVLVCASSTEKKAKEQLAYTGNKNAANVIGELIAERAKAKKITKVAFDCSGYTYHGRVKELADSARKNGLIF